MFLLILFIFTACNNELSDTIPSGNGRVLFFIDDFNRTITPSAVFISKFELAFTGPKGTKINKEITNTFGSFSLELNPSGDWNVSVVAYIEKDGNNIAFAQGNTSFTVSANTTQAVRIVLEPKESNLKGSFVYSLETPSGSTVKLTIRKADGTIVEAETTVDTEGSLELFPGVYLVQFSILKGDKAAGITEALYIYSALTSFYEESFTDDRLKQTVNSGFDLTSLLNIPVAGERVPQAIAIETEQFTGSVEWRTNTANAGAFFWGSTAYRAVITLDAKQDYTFTGFAGGFSYTGATVNYSKGGSILTEEGETITTPDRVTIIFPNTNSYTPPTAATTLVSWNKEANYSTGTNENRVRAISWQAAYRPHFALNPDLTEDYWQAPNNLFDHAGKPQFWILADLNNNNDTLNPQQKPIDYITVQINLLSDVTKFSRWHVFYSNNATAVATNTITSGGTSGATGNATLRPTENATVLQYWIPVIDVPIQQSNINQIDFPSRITARYILLVAELNPTSSGNPRINKINFWGPGIPRPDIKFISIKEGDIVDTVPFDITAQITTIDGAVVMVFNGDTYLGDAEIDTTNPASPIAKYTINNMSEGYHNIRMELYFPDTRRNNTSAQIKVQTFDPDVTAVGNSLVQIEPLLSSPELLKPGYPAIIRTGTTLPSLRFFQFGANITVSAGLTFPNGSRTTLFTNEQFIKGAPAHIKQLTETASAAGLYIIDFTINDGLKTLYDKIYLTAITQDVNQYIETDFQGRLTNAYPAAERNRQTGKMVYAPDYKGNRIIDYSTAGYKGGGVAIPNIPAVITLNPLPNPNDNAWSMIQNAINEVSNMPVGVNGFRGAVHLNPGVYRIGSQLRINRSGVVLRGSGDGHASIKQHNVPFSPSNEMTIDGKRGAGYFANEAFEAGVTKIISTWTNSSVIIDVSGSAGSTTGAVRYVRDQYVPAGEKTIRLNEVTGINPGDTVMIRRLISDDWVDAIGMYGIPLSGNNRWYTSYFNGGFNMEREVVSVNPIEKTITLLESFTDSVDYRWGIAEVRRFNTGGRIENVGIENLQVISGGFNRDVNPSGPNTYLDVAYLSFDNEAHAQTFIRFSNVHNSWARNFVTYHLDTAVSFQNGAKFITVQDASCLDPVSGIGGSGNRYSFNNNGGTNILVQRTFARYPRHAYIVGSVVSGPFVFRDVASQHIMNASEPHLRWSSGGLYELVRGDKIAIQNRWNAGTAHGWAGINYVLWNCGVRGDPLHSFLVSQPSIAPNYAIGIIGIRADWNYSPALHARNNPAYEYSMGRNVTPESLYLQQLEDRLGKNAVTNVTP